MIDRVHPIRSAITVAGMSGVARSSSRIAGSTASTIEPLGARTYFGGTSRANARRTAFLETPSRRAIALIAIPSTRCSLRISAQSSTVITLLSVAEGVRFQPTLRGQFPGVADSLVGVLWRSGQLAPTTRG